ncbi:uncharacterized protein SCODWIG_03577 [Saccharomycodes ludwigii]|uniref:Uncharacterized protein n=1 Tax=Saccharomycodes ludwigii TaxID=36035 RepID=A0A376BAZ5_9ASCO|nr:uncharacterized protein SCODWIG_03577 [Saccharomycodes ludwigii]
MLHYAHELRFDLFLIKAYKRLILKQRGILEERDGSNNFTTNTTLGNNADNVVIIDIEDYHNLKPSTLKSDSDFKKLKNAEIFESIAYIYKKCYLQQNNNNSNNGFENKGNDISTTSSIISNHTGHNEGDTPGNNIMVNKNNGKNRSRTNSVNSNNSNTHMHPGSSALQSNNNKIQDFDYMMMNSTTRLPKSSIEIYQKFCQIIRELDLNYSESIYSKYFIKLTSNLLQIKSEKELMFDPIWNSIHINFNNIPCTSGGSTYSNSGNNSAAMSKNNSINSTMANKQKNNNTNSSRATTITAATTTSNNTNTTANKATNNTNLDYLNGIIPAEQNLLLNQELLLKVKKLQKERKVTKKGYYTTPTSPSTSWMNNFLASTTNSMGHNNNNDNNNNDNATDAATNTDISELFTNMSANTNGTSSNGFININNTRTKNKQFNVIPTSKRRRRYTNCAHYTNNLSNMTNFNTGMKNNSAFGTNNNNKYMNSSKYGSFSYAPSLNEDDYDNFRDDSNSRNITTSNSASSNTNNIDVDIKELLNFANNTSGNNTANTHNSINNKNIIQEEEEEEEEEQQQQQQQQNDDFNNNDINGQDSLMNNNTNPLNTTPIRHHRTTSSTSTSHRSSIITQSHGNKMFINNGSTNANTNAILDNVTNNIKKNNNNNNNNAINEFDLYDRLIKEKDLRIRQLEQNLELQKQETNWLRKMLVEDMGCVRSMLKDLNKKKG